METREKYLEHVQKMFELAGDKPDVAAAEAKTVLAIETGLAKASMDRTARRDPKNRDHMMKVAEAPDAGSELRARRNTSPQQRRAQVQQPERRQSDFFKQVNEQLERVPLDDWKTYLRWQRSSTTTLRLSARHSSTRISNSTASTCPAQKEMEPRWKRCVASTDSGLGDGARPALR